MESQNASTVDQMLENLQNFKSGEEIDSPDIEESEFDIEIIEDLPKRHSEIVRTRDEIDREFLRVVNTLEPYNPWAEDAGMTPPYPLTMDQIDLSYCKKTSYTWARCGPRRGRTWVAFSADKHAMGKMTDARFYEVLVHEATHITEGSYTPGSGHNPRYWEQLSDNAVKFLKSGEFDVDPSEFVTQCRNDPNTSMTDRRSMTVDQQQQAVEDRILSQL